MRVIKTFKCPDTQTLDGRLADIEGVGEKKLAGPEIMGSGMRIMGSGMSIDLLRGSRVTGKGASEPEQVSGTFFGIAFGLSRAT